MTDSSRQRVYNMYPQKSFAGKVRTEVLEDGRIKYQIEMFGMEEPTIVIADPANPEEMRGIKQLHMIMLPEDEEEARKDFVIAGDTPSEIVNNIRRMFRPVEPSADTGETSQG